MIFVLQSDSVVAALKRVKLDNYLSYGTARKTGTGLEEETSFNKSVICF